MEVITLFVFLIAFRTVHVHCRSLNVIDFHGEFKDRLLYRYILFR